MVSIKITQTEGNLDMKNLGSSRNLTSRIQENKERLSDLEDTIEEMDTFVKENVKSKTYLAGKKNPGNLGHNEKNKSKSDWNRRRKSNTGQRDRKDL